jgi:SAM-dependent methyltransferase
MEKKWSSKQKRQTRAILSSILLAAGCLFTALPLYGTGLCATGIINGVDPMMQRLLRNGFNIGRKMLYSPIYTNVSPETTYEDLFDPSFISYVDINKSTLHALDMGAGRGASGIDFYNLHIPADGVVYSKPEDFSDFGFNTVFVGDILGKDHPLKQSKFKKKYNLILDAYGPFSYLHDIRSYLEFVGHLLSPGGRFYSVYDSHVLDRDADRKPIIGADGEYIVKSGFRVIDDLGNDVTQDWFRAIRGLMFFQTKQAPVYPQERYGHFVGGVEHPPYFSFAKRLDIFKHLPIVDSRSAGAVTTFNINSNRLAIVEELMNSPQEWFKFQPELQWNQVAPVTIVQAGNINYVETKFEEVNDFATLSFIRTNDELFIPPIQEVSFEDGRPPLRIYRLVKP